MREVRDRRGTMAQAGLGIHILEQKEGEKESRVHLMVSMVHWFDGFAGWWLAQREGSAHGKGRDQNRDRQALPSGINISMRETFDDRMKMAFCRWYRHPDLAHFQFKTFLYANSPQPFEQQRINNKNVANWQIGSALAFRSFSSRALHRSRHIVPAPAGSAKPDATRVKSLSRERRIECTDAHVKPTKMQRADRPLPSKEL